MSKISVILTTYNRVNKLKRAVKSVLNQTFTDWELIIVDDHSNDKTQKYCEKMVNKDSRIRYIRRKSNFGQHTRPKNEGTKAAKTDLIAYLDDDNKYLRDHLQVLYKYIGKNDIIYGDRWLIDDSGKRKKMMGVARDFDAMELSRMNYIDTSDVLIRKECIEKIGGWDEDLMKFADWNLWVRLAKYGFNFKRIPVIITDYHIHEGCNQFKQSSERDPQTGQILPTFSPDNCSIYPNKTSYGERPDMKVAIFTLTMDRIDYTKKMYKTMKDKAGYNFDWFVVDNGSDDGTQYWLDGKAKTKYNKKNVGISKGSNQALDMIGDNYELIIKVDNDCEFITDNWLVELVNFYQSQRNFVLSPRVEGLRDNPGGVPRTQYVYVGEHFLGLAPHLGGICEVAPAKIYKNFRWEDKDFLHGDQDYVFSQYAVNNGFILAYHENIIVEHIDSTSGQANKYPEYEEAKKKLKTTKNEH